MKRLLAIIFTGAILAAVPATAALPSLSDLATSLATLRERIENATNETAQLRARLTEVTNLTAKFERIANMNRETRRAFHGEELPSRFETNLATRIIQRIDVYEDGFEFVNPGGTRYYTPEEMAARIANRKSGVSIEERIDAVRKQIAELEAKKNNGTNELEAAYAVIQIAQKQKTLARLEASQTNTVTVVTTP